MAPLILFSYPLYFRISFWDSNVISITA
uniref:Uncharacterized protein n=1 Tax=Anguilla anguilla TaxID=7936 RepID=A0A0E9T397_ANGAN